MNYVEITNGQITKGPMNLPKNYKNTSGFNLQSDAELKAIGWYPVEYVSVAYNSASHYIDGQDLTILENKVKLTDKIGAFTRFQLETNAYNDYHSNWETLDREMDRAEEDHITVYHDGLPGSHDRGSNKRTQKAIYDERVAKRAAPAATPVPPKEGEPDYVEPV